MAAKIVDKLLPTTMVGSYPRPQWFKHQLLGRDIRVAFKEVQHEEAYNDAVATVIRDQQEAGLDIVTDGNAAVSDLDFTLHASDGCQMQQLCAVRKSFQTGWKVVTTPVGMVSP